MAVDNCTTEFFIDGAWTKNIGGVDLDHRVRKNPGVTISRGTADQQSTATADSSEFTVNNSDGIFSNRNALSVLFRKFPRYTKVRHYIPRVAGDLDSYVRFFRPDNTGTLSTTDKAALEITGDIDIRIELTPDSWLPSAGTVIAGKYRISTGANRGWMIWLNTDQDIAFRWSTDGTATNTVFFDYPTSGNFGRRAIRITMDVDNGAAGRTITFYTAPSIGGTWTQQAQTITPGVTSIYGLGTAPLELGNVDLGSPLTGVTQFYGKIHAFELRSGINGTVVANMSAAPRDIGTTAWADGLGNTWTITGTARVGSDRIRHTGEIDTKGYKWDTTRRDVYLPLKSMGALNRMQEAGAPLRSAVYRQFQSYPSRVGYWPLEVNKNSAAGTTFSILNDCSAVANPSWLPGSAGALRLNSSTSKFTLGASGRTSTGENSAVWCFNLDNLPASDKTLVTMTSNGTIRRWEFQVGAAGYAWKGYNSADAIVVNENTLFGVGAEPNLGGMLMQLTLTQEGANVRYTTRWAGVGRSNFYTHAVGGETYPGTVGRFGQFVVDAAIDSAFSGAEVAHVLFSTDIVSVNTADRLFINAANGFLGELAGVRAARLAVEEDLDFELYGDPSATEAMGYQTPDTPYSLLAECAKVDGGLLFDLRDRFAIGMRTRIDMENQLFNGWDVAYGDSLLSEVPDPVEDGRYTKNDMTLSRPGGVVGGARATLDSGELSTQEPPNGIGPRPGSDSVNAGSDEQLERLAEYRVWLSTRDEMRIPSLTFELHRSQLEVTNTQVYERVIAATLGDWVRLTGLPAFVDPALNKRMLALGYSETYNGHLWTITFNTVTADGFRVPIASYIILADDGTTRLNAAITSGATSMVLRTPTSSRPWVNSVDHPGDFPITTYVGGELITITALTAPAIVGSDYQQTATITRAGNGIVKAQVINELVEVQTPYYLGL